LADDGVIRNRLIHPGLLNFEWFAAEMRARRRSIVLCRWCGAPLVGQVGIVRDGLVCSAGCDGLVVARR